jgi:hypothetical protein
MDSEQTKLLECANYIFLLSTRYSPAMSDVSCFPLNVFRMIQI